MRKFLLRTCRVLFSRYAISALMIVFEVSLIVLLLVSNITIVYYLIGLALILASIATLNLINREANPEYKVTWLCLIFILPVIGPVLYFLFYNRRMSKRESRLLGGILKEMRSFGFSREAMDRLAEQDSLAAGKARALLADYEQGELFAASTSVFFGTGEEFFEDMISELKTAKEYIFLEYFIIDEGELWDSVHTILREKAAQGVDVRLLYDDIGCMKTLPSHYELGLRREGIKTFRFARVNPRVSSMHHNRDHRKICVIDGRVGYTGGVNIADEYINREVRFGHWKDGGIRLDGDAVLGLVRMFVASWDYTSGTISDHEYFLRSVIPSPNPDGGYYLPFGSGPSPIYKRPVGKNVFLNIINQAQSYVYITTPYLIIDYDLTGALRNAALRGVDVRIITPGVADKKVVKVMTKSAYPYLMESGVRIYEYTPGFIHEKTLVSDDRYAVIGTINFDYRSLVHHFEDAVWIYGTPTVIDARDEFLTTQDKSEQMDEKSARLSLTEKMFKMFNRIFAPLL